MPDVAQASRHPAFRVVFETESYLALNSFILKEVRPSTPSKLP